MKFFHLIDTTHIVASSDKKVIPASEFSKLLSGEELIETIKQEQADLLVQFQTKMAELDQSGEEKGFQRGLEKWNEQLMGIQKEINNVREEMIKTIVPLAMTAVKKIIGHEIETNPHVIIDLVKTSLKSVSQHKRVKIYVNKSDLTLIEQERANIKTVFEGLESLSIAPRDDVEAGGCIIETEAGIINASLDRQLATLEGAFKAFFEQGDS